MGSFDDLEVQKIISNISTQEDFLEKNSVRVLEDCIQRIKEKQLKAKRQSISELMVQAKESGDEDRLKDLMHEFNRLIKVHPKKI